MRTKLSTLLIYQCDLISLIADTMVQLGIEKIEFKTPHVEVDDGNLETNLPIKLWVKDWDLIPLDKRAITPAAIREGIPFDLVDLSCSMWQLYQETPRGTDIYPLEGVQAILEEETMLKDFIQRQLYHYIYPLWSDAGLLDPNYWDGEVEPIIITPESLHRELEELYSHRLRKSLLH